jgi:radical SAM protein with 4Fe4S-binding SPASM domain
MNLFNVVLIETQNTCTRKCWFCKFGQDRQDAKIMSMDDEIILKIADDLHKLDYSGRISPFGINEPLLEPRIFQIIKLLKLKCPYSFISINSNGDRLTEEVYQELIEAGLDGLGLSVYDNRGMKKLQKYSSYENVSIIDMRHPEDKIENRTGEIKINQELFKSKEFVHCSCERPFNMLVIRPSGNVVLCCADMYGDVVMGNVSENSLEDIWNSEYFNLYRSELKTKGRANLNLCKTCSHNGTTSSARPH